MHQRDAETAFDVKLAEYGYTFSERVVGPRVLEAWGRPISSGELTEYTAKADRFWAFVSRWYGDYRWCKRMGLL